MELSNAQETKVRENRLRQAARRRYRATLVKSHRRDPLAWDYGRYWLIVPGFGEVIGAAGSPGIVGDPPGLTLDEVEEWLDDMPARPEVTLDELNQAAGR